jgi:hypothetical protein
MLPEYSGRKLYLITLILFRTGFLIRKETTRILEAGNATALPAAH